MRSAVGSAVQAASADGEAAKRSAAGVLEVVREVFLGGAEGGAAGAAAFAPILARMPKLNI